MIYFQFRWRRVGGRPKFYWGNPQGLESLSPNHTSPSHWAHGIRSHFLTNKISVSQSSFFVFSLLFFPQKMRTVYWGEGPKLSHAFWKQPFFGKLHKTMGHATAILEGESFLADWHHMCWGSKLLLVPYRGWSSTQ